MFTFANLDDVKLKEIREFEAKSGLRVVALADVDLEPAPVASDTVEELRKMEQDLGVCLLAVK
jgi:hypothetical protein